MSFPSSAGAGGELSPGGHPVAAAQRPDLFGVQRLRERRLPGGYFPMRINRLLKRELMAKTCATTDRCVRRTRWRSTARCRSSGSSANWDLIPVSGSAADGGGAGGGLRHPAPAPAYRHQRRALRRAGRAGNARPVLADIPADALGAPVHASIDGRSPPSRSRPLRL